MNELRDIAQNTEDESLRDEGLRQAVSRAVLEGMITGYTMANEDDNTEAPEKDLQDGDADSTKRRRLDEPDGQL